MKIFVFPFLLVAKHEGDEALNYSASTFSAQEHEGAIALELVEKNTSRTTERSFLCYFLKFLAVLLPFHRV